MGKVIDIAICDDEYAVASGIENLLDLLSRKYQIAIEVDVFYDGATLTDYIKRENKRYDIIYIDIEMKIENGVDAAKKIRRMDKNVMLIYVTNYESFAKEVFEVSAYRFITKPVSNAIFEKYFLDAVKEINTAPHFFQFQYNKIRYKEEISNILYFQSDKRITYIHMRTGIRKCYEKLNAIEEKLEENAVFFFRIHQSFLVNPKYIEIYMYDRMQLQNGTTLSVSENRRKRISELYCKLKGDSIIV